MKEFVIVSASRTGSSLLVALLRSRHLVEVAGELFNPRMREKAVPWELVSEDRSLIELRREDPARFLENLAERARSQKAIAWGFKLHYEHVFGNPKVLEYLVDRRDVFVIHLRRRNRLRRYLSNQKARRDGKWMALVSDPEQNSAPIYLDPASVAIDFVRTEQSEIRIAKALGGHAMHETWYEELEVDPQGSANGVLEFMGIPEAPMSTTIRKTGTDPLATAISNYDDLQDMFTKWAAFFDDPGRAEE